MINPFFLSLVSSLSVLFLLYLGWTDLFATPDIPVLVFILILAIINVIFAFGIRFDKVRVVKAGKSNVFFGIVLLLLYLVNFMYSGEWALVNVLTNTGSYYKDIKNIPTIFPLAISLNVYLIIRTFVRYCYTSNSRELLYFLLLLMPILLTMGRGVFVISLLTCFICYIRVKGVLSSKRIFLYSFLFVFFIGVVFSIWGQVRSESNEVLNAGNEKLTKSLSEMSGANESFYALDLPENILWVYVYAVSPLSNFNNAIRIGYQSDSCSMDFLGRSFFPESVQNNFMPAFEELRGGLVSPIFNVSTMYFLPFYYCGWMGVLLMLLSLYFIFILGYISVRNTSYYDSYLSLMGTVFLLGFFSNIFVLDVVFIPLALMVFGGLSEKMSVLNLLPRNTKSTRDS